MHMINKFNLFFNIMRILILYKLAINLILTQNKNKGKITFKLYKNFVNNTLFSQMRIIALISEKTAKVWLKKLGLVSQSQKKSIYFDEHKHSDVLEYRTIFLKKIEEFEQLMLIF